MSAPARMHSKSRERTKEREKGSIMAARVAKFRAPIETSSVLKELEGSLLFEF